jgi:hypothetical protein
MYRQRGFSIHGCQASSVQQKPERHLKPEPACGVPDLIMIQKTQG